MSTDRELIEQAQRDVKPRDVIYAGPVPEAGTLTPLSCGCLKRLVENGTRRMNWEEWLDVRDAWCRCFRVVYVACTRGDRTAIRNAALQGERTGQNYILIDYI
ncbi:hypothetical protein [Bacteriophage sp.]|nr:hypothetical protein [Caudoviricetes sp.]UOF79995.1 hypothetical protein [Bacteriophage sp.]